MELQWGFAEFPSGRGIGPGKTPSSFMLALPGVGTEAAGSSRWTAVPSALASVPSAPSPAPRWRHPTRKEGSEQEAAPSDPRARAGRAARGEQEAAGRAGACQLAEGGGPPAASHSRARRGRLQPLGREFLEGTALDFSFSPKTTHLKKHETKEK